MEIESVFEVPVSVDRAWVVLTDVEQVAACMPGAELTEVADDGTYQGKVKVKVGPIHLSFAGEARFIDLDKSAKRMRMKAKGKETKGRGSAEATITSQLTAAGDSTRVEITTDVQLSGSVAQYGRNMISDVSTHLVGRFADCLALQLAGGGEQAEAAIARAGKGVPALRLILTALWAVIRRFFRRITGRSNPTDEGRPIDG